MKKLFIFAFIIFLVGLFSFYKLFVTKPTYVYVKVKLGQGLWWATTAKPTRWFIDSIKVGEKEHDITGKFISEIKSVKYFPVFLNGFNGEFSDQYNVFLTLKLQVTGNKKINKYYFKRAILGVGAPIEFEFPSAQFSGTIIDLKEQPFAESFEEKNIILSKKSDDISEYQSIRIGDYYFDGQEKAIQIIDKSFNQGIISLNVKIRLKKINDQLLLGEEETVVVNKRINFLTVNSLFYDYYVQEIQ